MGLTFAKSGKIHNRIKNTQNPDITVALMGNPNVGKSTLFNSVTGMHQHTGNWPGKTVAGAVGFCTHKKRNVKIVDLPGCYSLFSHSQEEEVARDYICSGEADVTVVVCDGTALERNLILALMAKEITDNIVLCVNLIDEAEKKGIVIDKKKLQEALGVPVVFICARQGKGLAELMDKIVTFRKKDEGVAKIKDSDEETISQTVKRAEEIAKSAVRYKKENYLERDRKIDRLLTGRGALPSMAILVILVLWITIFGANYISEFLSSVLFKSEKMLNAFLVSVNMPDFLRELVVFGGYRMLVWVVSVMLPPMAIFFPLFTLLEDLGYLPRVAFNLDRGFSACGACGKQALTMCMGFGCNAAGVVGARIIDSPRERLIAIVTNSLVPCNGRFPALISIISVFLAGGAFGIFKSIAPALLLAAFLVLSVAVTLLSSKLLSETVLSGEPSSFALELPPYRRPQIGKVIVRSIFDRTLFVLSRAVVSAIPAGLLLWLLANVSLGGESLFAHFCAYLTPLGNLLGLDGVILAAFILGFPANETVVPIMIMGYLSGGVLSDSVSLFQLKDVLIANGWDTVTAVNTIIFFLFHWPCATTMLTIFKETKSAKWTFLSFLLPTIIGVILCILINSACNLFA